MLREEVEIYSKKYNVNGVVRDYGFVTKLFFTYEGKDIEMGIKRNILADEKFEDVGLELLESYIDNLSKHVEGQKLQLHYWYIEEYERDGQILSRARGIVTGHKKLQDSYSITTTRIYNMPKDNGIHCYELLLLTLALPHLYELP